MPLVDYGLEEEDEGVEVDAGDVFGLSTLASTSTKPAAAAPVAGPSTARSALGNAAPDVLATDIMDSRSSALIPAGASQLMVNLSHEQMSQPMVGPVNPYSERRLEKMNTTNGFVEQHAMSDADFLAQYRSFNNLGYAHNPSNIGGVDATTGAPLVPFVGDVHRAYQTGGALIDRAPRSEVRNMKRKRNAKGTLGVVELDGEAAEDADPDRPREYLGPWAGWESEKIAPAIPTAEEYEEIEKKSFKRVAVEKENDSIAFGSETSVFHGKSFRDYQGRTYMDIPRDVGVNLDPDEPGQQTCYVPKKCIHTWAGHQKGISKIRLFPNSGHLLLSASMDSNVKLWDIYHEGKCLRTYKGHARAVRDVTFSNDGRRFLTASFDSEMKLWDTETGACLKAFTTGHVPNCIKFHPAADKQHIFLAGMQNKKIVQFDMNSGEIVQEYNEHLGPVNTITFYDESRRFLTTSDDKAIRRDRAEIADIADPSMHSMPAATINPDQTWIAMQSLDNQIALFSTETNRLNRKKAFRGHSSAGYACEPGFSPDGKYVSSGDSGGRLHVWEFKTGRKNPNPIQCHNRALVSHAWLPHETSKIVTSGYDGTMKLWD